MFHVCSCTHVVSVFLLWHNVTFQNYTWSLPLAIPDPLTCCKSQLFHCTSLPGSLPSLNSSSH